MKALKDLLFSSVAFDTNPIIDMIFNAITVFISGSVAYKLVGRAKDYIWFLSSSTMSKMNFLLTIAIFLVLFCIYVIVRNLVYFIINGGFILLLPVLFIHAFMKQFNFS